MLQVEGQERGENDARRGLGVSFLVKISPSSFLVDMPALAGDLIILMQPCEISYTG